MMMGTLVDSNAILPAGSFPRLPIPLEAAFLDSKRFIKQRVRYL